MSAIQRATPLPRPLERILDFFFLGMIEKALDAYKLRMMERAAEEGHCPFCGRSTR